MYYSNSQIYNPANLEYIIRNSYSNINYLSKSFEDDYFFREIKHIFSKKDYNEILPEFQPYKIQQLYRITYTRSHSFSPEIFLFPIRLKTYFIENFDEIKNVVKQTFELMLKKEFPEDISMSILPFNEFKLLHSIFGYRNNGILGFSINGKDKKIFVRENNLDILMIVIGHEIGHVLTETLSNKHDEEAKAFAFTIEWAKTIKEHNIADLGVNIKDELEFKPAKNGLHDVAFSFVNFIIRKGKKAIELHDDLVKKYISIFNRLYF